MSTKLCWRVGVLLLSVCAVSLPAAGGLNVAGVVAGVAQGEYTSYHIAIESMGLGLYGGPDYNQGVRNRDGWAGDGTLGNQEARLYLGDKLGAMGMSVEVQGEYHNVVADLPGWDTPGNVYIVSAHYDHVGGDRPGGDDNASGTAGMMEAARILSRYRFGSTIRFIGFNAEEDGLRGSKDYVNNVIVGGNETIAGVINLDMILRPAWDGDPDEPADMDIATRPIAACLSWANTFINAAGTYAPSLLIDTSSPYTTAWGGSDHAPFADAGYPAFLAIENAANEVWSGQANHYYHKYEDASDRLANDPNSPSGVTYDYAFATDIVRATVATISQEAGLLAGPGDANVDGTVDDDDLSLLLANWRIGSEWAHGDFDASGDVDDDDLSRLLSNWVGVSAMTVVPEPTTVAMLGAAMMVMLRRGRGRGRAVR